MNWIEVLVTITGSVFASSGLWSLILYKIKKNDSGILMTRGMAHYRIIEEGQKFIERGWITHEEYDDFMKYLGDPYLESGSNGLAKKMIDDISDLPFKSISSINSNRDHQKRRETYMALNERSHYDRTTGKRIFQNTNSEQ